MHPQTFVFAGKNALARSRTWIYRLGGHRAFGRGSPWNQCLRVFLWERESTDLSGSAWFRQGLGS